MADTTEELHDLWTNTYLTGDDYPSARAHAKSLFKYVLFLSIFSSVISTVSVILLGSVGAIIAFITNIVLIYYICNKLFMEVENMVRTHIRQREIVLKNSLED